MPSVEISGYDECGSEAETQGIMREKPGNRSGMGTFKCEESNEGIKVSCPFLNCQEKSLDSLFPFVYDNQGDCDE